MTLESCAQLVPDALEKSRLRSLTSHFPKIQDGTGQCAVVMVSAKVECKGEDGQILGRYMNTSDFGVNSNNNEMLYKVSSKNIVYLMQNEL